jgi:hypothetical protein
LAQVLVNHICIVNGNAVCIRKSCLVDAVVEISDRWQIARRS